MRSCDNVKISSSAVRRGLSRNHGAAWISSAPVSEAPVSFLVSFKPPTSLRFKLLNPHFSF